ncbi:MAG: TonB-dependent receptor [Saprospiraceae bacterium]
MFTTLHSQEIKVSGYILDSYNQALFGAYVATTKSRTGTTTDINGFFELSVDQTEPQLRVTYIGFKSLIINVIDMEDDIKIILYPDILQMEEIVVSANFNEKSKLESSVSVSLLSAFEINELAPTSAIEALKIVPGIYINDANGEVGVEIFGRGLSTPYFSLQEDGLPSSISEMSSNEKFTRDMFIRSDLMSERVEAVRGGSASIVSANSPGGIFNYITRVGKEDFEIEIQNRVGIQANENEVYNKLETFIGGRISHSGWHYAIGGHVRYDGGIQKSLYPHSQGGQLKLNLTKFYGDDLSVKIIGKYLNDRVGFNRPTLVQGWDNIQPALGFNFENNLVLPDVAFNLPDGRRIKEDPTAFKNIRSRDQQKVKERAIGLNVNYNLIDNWQVKLSGKFSKKSLIINHIAEEGGMATISANSLFARLFSNFDLFFTDLAPMVFGEYQVYDLETNETLATVNTEALIRGQIPQISMNNLPGNGEIFWALVNNDELKITEFVQQLSLNGQLENHALTLGAYYSLAHNDRVLNSATAFLTVEEEPRLLGTRVIMADFAQFAQFAPELLPVAHLSNQTAVFNNSTGLHSFNSLVNEYNLLDETTISVFVSDEWKLNANLNIDAGLRYETIKHSGRSGITEVQDADNELGGIDGNALTVSDNIYGAFSGEYLDFDVDYSGLSYSAGLNYKLNENTATYARYSHSEKLLDALYVQENFTNGNPPIFKPREVTQTEIGLKYSKDRFGLFAVGYLSTERNIFNQLLVISLSDPEGFYLTPPLSNSANYYGAEIEFNYILTPWWSLRNILNISGGTNQDYKVWNTGTSDTPDDDFLVDLSGLPVAGSTARKLDLSPLDITSIINFNKRRGSLVVNYRRYAEKFANIQQSFTLPSFNLWKVGVMYNINNNISAQFNINNLFNEIGILRFNGTNDIAGFAENVTKDFIDQNPNKWFKVQKSPGRSFYFTVNYSY